LFVAIVSGWLVGVLYGHVPALAAALEEPQIPGAAVGGAIAVPLALGLLIWLVGVFLETPWPNSRCSRWLTRQARKLAILGLIMAAVGLAVPLLVNWSDLLTSWLIRASPTGSNAAKTTAATATTVTVTGYIATVVAIFTAVGRAAGSAYAWLNKNRALISKVPALALQRLLVVVGATLLVVAHVYVFARVIKYVAGDQHDGLTHDVPLSQRYLVLDILLVLLLLATIFIDQTRWSLHPFYRKRLATAFAVRRLTDEKSVWAEAYTEDEWTYLETHCTYVNADCTDDPAAGFPQVILMATANVFGKNLTAPGCHALPYSLFGDWVGNPLLGWIRTETLRTGRLNPGRSTSRVLGADLTTQAAMAISGAAFASAMGAARSPYSLLFTLTNARLGAWLPNPSFLAHHRASAGSTGSARWHHPLLPRWRAMPYLLRELFGIYRHDRPLLLATDGGHYDNLGLVEMLRHAPRTIYCLDASGGSNLGGSALGPAIALARQELGVSITLPECPRGVASLEWAEKELNRVGVLVCNIDYTGCPMSDPPRPDRGVLYFARATVTPDAPWQLQAYRRAHPTFPNDSTSDQWFDQQQFDAYYTLGRYAATAVIDTQKRYEGKVTQKAGLSQVSP
jgi:hypothetical protein